MVTRKGTLEMLRVEMVIGKGTLEMLRMGDGYWKGDPGDAEVEMVIGKGTLEVLRVGHGFCKGDPRVGASGDSSRPW